MMLETGWTELLFYEDYRAGSWYGNQGNLERAQASWGPQGEQEAESAQPAFS